MAQIGARSSKEDDQPMTRKGRDQRAVADNHMFSRELSQRTVAAEGRTFGRKLLAVYFARNVSERGRALCSAANYRHDAVERGRAHCSAANYRHDAVSRRGG
eukprot:7777763-Pyramimonas_sp.AAC.1